MLLRKKVIRLTAWIFALMSFGLLALGLIFAQKLVSAGSTASDTRAPSSAQNEPVRPASDFALAALIYPDATGLEPRALRHPRSPYGALQATMASGRVRLATDGGEKIAR
jgi:hypothetical protein